MNSTTGRITAGVLAALAAVAVAVVHTMLVATFPGQQFDDTVMDMLGTTTGHDVPTPGRLAEVQVPILLFIGACIGAVCIARRSWRLLAHALIVMGVTIVVAVALKNGLDRPAFGISPLGNSFPSNTVAAFAAGGLALCAVLPPRARAVAVPAVAVGIVAVGIAVVALRWHRPSDVLGAVALAVAVAAATECALPVRRLHRHRAEEVVDPYAERRPYETV